MANLFQQGNKDKFTLKVKHDFLLFLSFPLGIREWTTEWDIFLK
jgi:hypothetical protein